MSRPNPQRSVWEGGDGLPARRPPRRVVAAPSEANSPRDPHDDRGKGPAPTIRSPFFGRGGVGGLMGPPTPSPTGSKGCESQSRAGGYLSPAVSLSRRGRPRRQTNPTAGDDCGRPVRRAVRPWDVLLVLRPGGRRGLDHVAQGRRSRVAGTLAPVQLAFVGTVAVLVVAVVGVVMLRPPSRKSSPDRTALRALRRVFREPPVS